MQSQESIEQTEKIKETPEGFDVIPEQSPDSKYTEKKGEAIFLFNEPTFSDAPRNVYHETVTSSISKKTEDYIWWHCDDSTYVGRKVIEEKRVNSEQKILKGYKYTIPYNEKNKAKIISLATLRTNFYRKEGEMTVKLKDPKIEF